MYSIEDYERPSVATDIIVFGVDTKARNTNRELHEKKLQILLIKRGETPFKNYFALPGGFLRPGENLEQAAHRELQEEAGITNAKLINIKPYSDPNRDPRGWIISCPYLALMNCVTVATSETSDATDPKWFDFDYKSTDKTETITLSSNDTTITISKSGDIITTDGLIAFDHSEMIIDAFKTLQESVSHNDMVFDLMPRYFTISDLQQVYEAVTYKKDVKAAFRRKFADKLLDSGKMESGNAHRPSKLFERKV